MASLRSIKRSSSSMYLSSDDQNAGQYESFLCSASVSSHTPTAQSPRSGSPREKVGAPEHRVEEAEKGYFGQFMSGIRAFLLQKCVAAAWSTFAVRDASTRISGSPSVTLDLSQAGKEKPLLDSCVRALGWKQNTSLFPAGDIAWIGCALTDGEHLEYSSVAHVVNRFPGFHELTKKRWLARVLTCMALFDPEGFSFFPRTWLLPEDRQAVENALRGPAIHPAQFVRTRTGCRRSWEPGCPLQYRRGVCSLSASTRSDTRCSSRSADLVKTITTHIRIPSGGRQFYILKPDGGAPGVGLKLISDFDQIPEDILEGRDGYVVQEYICNPYLLNNRKFDFRVYVLVTSVTPKLNVFVSRRSLVRFCTEDYQSPRSDNLHNEFMHLTNYAINKDHHAFVRSSNVHDRGSSKRLLDDVFEDLLEQNVDVESVWRQILFMVQKVMTAFSPLLALKYNSVYRHPTPRSRCFQIIGLDILLDSNCKAWLLEMNANPSLRSDYDYLTSSGLLATTESTLDRRVKEPLLSEALVIVYFTLLRPTLPVPARPKRPTNSQNRQPSKARFYHHQSHAWPEDRQIAARQRVWTSQKANDDSEMERTGEGKNCMICCGVACDPGTSRTESTSTCRYSQAVTLLSPREWSVSNTRSCASHDADHRPPSYWEREISNVPMGINYSIDCMFKPTAVPCVIPPRGRDPLGLRSQSANEFPGPAVPAASMRHLSLPSNRTASPRPNTDANDALFNTLPCQVSARCKLPVSLLCPAQFLVEKVQKEEGPYHTTVPRNATASVIPTYRTQESHQVSIKRRPARFPCLTSSGGALFSPPLRSKMPHPTAPSEASGYFLNVSPRTQQQPDMHGNGSSLPGSSAQQKNPNYFNCSGMNIDSGEAENPHSIFAIRRALEVQQESIPMESKNREFTTTAETPSSGSACTLDACQTSDTATGESADCLPQPHERLVNTCPDRSRRETILEGSFLKQQCCVWVPVVTASATSPSRFPSRALLLHACKKLFMRVTRYPCNFTIELKHWVTLISRTPLIEIVQRIWVPVLATSQTALRYPDRGSAKATTRTCRRFAQRPLAKRDLIFLYMQKVKFAQPGANLHSEQRGLCFWTFWELICILSSLTRLVLRNRKLDSTQERMVEIEAYCEAGGRGPPRNATREIADRIRSAPPHLFISSGECSEIGTSSAQSVEMAAGSGILDFLNNSEAEAGVQPDTEDDMAMLDDRSPKRETDSEKHSTADPCGQTFGSLGSSSGGGPRDRLKSKTTSNSRKTSSTSSPRSNDMAAKKQDNTSAGRQLGTICNRLDEKFCDSPVFVPWWPELDSAFRSLHPTERVTAVDSLLTTLLAEADRLYLDSL